MINAEQWKNIEFDLAGSFSHIKFNYKDAEISVSRVRLSESKTALAVYIDGEIGGGWGYEFGDGFHPLVSDIWRKRTKASYPPSKRKKLEKDFGKRRVKKLIPDIDKVHIYYDCCFNTAKSLVSQFKKLEGLTLISSVDEALCN